MHADQMEEITDAYAGDIVALFGVDCASGDSFSSGDTISVSSIYVPEPVVSLAVVPVDNKAQANLAKALGRFTREDPTFTTRKDEETGDTLIMGMGELHLEVYLERIRREYAPRSRPDSPRCPTARPSPRASSSTTPTRSRPAARGSTPASSASWSLGRRGIPLREPRGGRQHPHRVHPRGGKRLPVHAG